MMYLQTKKWLYLYDGWDIIAVMNGNGQIVETFTRGVGLAGDPARLAGHIAVTHHPGSSTNGTFYAHQNSDKSRAGHGGDIVLTRIGTTTVGSYSYSAFGSLHSALGTDICRFKFSSKEREASCDFYYYGYRFYAPQWQWWVSRDPIGEVAGLNLYQFVFNNSLTYADPDGSFWVLLSMQHKRQRILRSNYVQRSTNAKILVSSAAMRRTQRV